MVSRMIKLVVDGRGFRRGDFRDNHNQLCVIHESSDSGDSGLWLGVADHPMHLTQLRVRELLVLLATFLDIGKLK